MSDTQGLQGDFDSFENHLVAGSELLRQSRVDDAQHQLRLALELEPGNPKALALLGLAFFRGGQFDEAAPIYQALVGHAPDDASYRLNLGLVHLKLGNAEEAIVELSRCRALDPGQGRAIGYLGLAFARAGQYAEAYQAFLQSGQDDLAREVVHHLTAQERMAIEASVRLPTDPGLSQPHIAIGDVPLPSAAAQPVPLRDEPPVLRAATPLPPPPPPVAMAAVPGLVIQPHSDGAISRAVAQALPSVVAATGSRVAPGSRAPVSLSEFATARLVRPEDGDQPFEISAGGVLIVRVAGRMYSRTEGVDVTGGDLSYEVATRRVRGAQSGEPFAAGERQMYLVSGNGILIASALGGEFTTVQLDDDIFYLREDVVFAFEPTVRWENGHVPGSQARIPMVQFRGGGAVAFRTPRPLLAVKLSPERVLYIDANALAGWIGRVVPRAVSPAGTSRLSELFVECTGEGVVLVQEEAGINLAVPVKVVRAREAAEAAEAEAAEAAAVAPAPDPEPAARGEATLSLDDDDL